jgi:signal transduction histidine kinase
MIDVGVLLGLATLIVGVAAAFVLRLLPTLRLQLAALALLAVVLPLGAVLASGLVMFHMHDDVKILAVSSASALAAVVGALLLARWILAAIDRLHVASERLAAGDLTARAPQRGVKEIAELGGSFNQMATAVEELFDARRQLVAWASHDLRTPLASMNAMLEALEDGLVPLERYLPPLRERVQTLNSLVDDLFELARIDAGVLTIELQDTRLDQVVAGCVRSFEAQARRQQVRLEARLAEPLPAVRCAPDKVERVLLNLLTNALSHTPSDGSIAVFVSPTDDGVEVAVEDTGSGIDAGSERRIFDRFWRGDASRSSDGAGLGLAIAQGLIEAQGGRIWAENRPEGGARVAFALPVAGLVARA